MTRLVPATLFVVAFWTGAPASAQDAPTPQVLQQAPDRATRGPVNVAPAQPDAPVRLETPGKIDVTPADASAGEPRATDRSEVYAQRRGGGAARGGPRGGGNGRGMAGPARGRPYPIGVARGGWGGGGWGSPVYFARPYYFDPFWASGAFGWSPMFYAPWSLMWGTTGYWPGAWMGATTFNTGNVRLKVKPRDAQVLVDGYVAGVVDEFDGVFQSLRLAPGGHKIEVRMPGFETLSFDVHVQPNRTMTLTESMRVAP